MDRINNDGNYEPSNCRWADWRTQTTNKSSNVFVEYKGTTKTIVEWAEELKMRPHTLQERLKNGWDVERAFFDKTTSNNHYSRNKILVQYDKCGNVVKKYNSLSELRPPFLKKGISNAIYKNQSYKGYIWKYEDE